MRRFGIGQKQCRAKEFIEHRSAYRTGGHILAMIESKKSPVFPRKIKKLLRESME
jgi:hypothetical protein